MRSEAKREALVDLAVAALEVSRGPGLTGELKKQARGEAKILLIALELARVMSMRSEAKHEALVDLVVAALEVSRGIPGGLTGELKKQAQGEAKILLIALERARVMSPSEVRALADRMRHEAVIAMGGT